MPKPSPTPALEEQLPEERIFDLVGRVVGYAAAGLGVIVVISQVLR